MDEEFERKTITVVSSILLVGIIFGMIVGFLIGYML
ncbi:hypothetical protein IX334_001919 [Bacteroides pyogenes]|nr:hypothetical protein [Bacteroides pyogenes]MBR8737707.1 hypothetical protein [Bacteroides pyogenes]MBR8753247.1 hypothetical protein [Bacteroides pyogenes]MBR8794669.1 hypothetical protein [Bacteroides pyogenes]